MEVVTLPELARSRESCTVKRINNQVFGEGGLAEFQVKENQFGHSVISPKGMNKAENRRQNERLRGKLKLKWNKNSLRIGGMRRGLDSSRDSIFDSSQLTDSQVADSCLGTNVGQAGFRNGELWQMNTERYKTQSQPSL